MNINKILIGVFSIVLAFIIYINGFDGGFLLDDTANLNKLKIFNLSKGADKFINFLLSSDASILKRPLSNLSFLIHARDWPADPYWFKFFNFIFHALNAILLFFFTINILKLLKVSSKIIFTTALLSSFIWLIHPYLISTVLYPIQRMAILPVTFILIGMLSYLKGRKMLGENHKTANIWLLFAVFACTTLATLSKENGIMLPLFLLILEVIVLKGTNVQPLKKWHKVVFFVLPLSTIALVFAIQMPKFLNQYGLKDFSLFERLISEFRVVSLYLYHFFVPGILTEGVYTDGFAKSSGWLQPVTTLYSIIFLMVIMILAWLFRKKFQIFSFAILFFFASLFLESTFVPLELYFEHRAYMASLFLPLLIILPLMQIAINQKYIYVIVFLIIILMGYNTYQKSIIWGNNLRLHLETARKFPNSIRVNTATVTLLEEKGRYKEAIKFLKNAIARNNNVQLQVKLLNDECLSNTVDKEGFKQLNNKLKTVPLTYDDAVIFSRFIKKSFSNICFKESPDEPMTLINSLSENPNQTQPEVRYFTMRMKAIVFIKRKENIEALKIIEKFISEAKGVPIITWSLEFVTLMFEKNDLDSAEKILDMISSDSHKLFLGKDIYLTKRRVQQYYQYINENRIH